MMSVRDRQIVSSCLFVYDIFNGTVKTNSLKSMLIFREVSNSLRTTTLLNQPMAFSHYVDNCQVCRCICLCNEYCTRVQDSTSRNTFESELREREAKRLRIALRTLFHFINYENMHKKHQMNLFYSTFLIYFAENAFFCCGVLNFDRSFSHSFGCIILKCLYILTLLLKFFFVQKGQV